MAVCRLCVGAETGDSRFLPDIAGNRSLYTEDLDPFVIPKPVRRPEMVNLDHHTRQGNMY